MTLNSRQLTATLIATLVMLTMSSSAHAAALTSYRGAVMADAPLAYRHLDETSGISACGKVAGRRGKSAVVILRISSACS